MNFVVKGNKKDQGIGMIVERDRRKKKEKLNIVGISDMSVCCESYLTPLHGMGRFEAESCASYIPTN